MIINKLAFSIAFSVFILCNCKVNAQIAEEILNILMNEDSMDVNTVATCPQNIPENINKASAHPEEIVKLDVIQKNSNQAFKKQIASFSKPNQGKIYNLSRYNNLIHQLIQSSTAENELKLILTKYPNEIHDDALFFVTHHRGMLNSLESLDKEFYLSFSVIDLGYSAEDNAAFSNLLNAPEAINLLNQNLHMTKK